MRGWWSPGTSTGMTAVKSLSFAQHKSEQNKIVIAKAGYHRGDGILPLFCGIKVALCELGRPLYGGMGQSLRTQEKGQALTYRGVLSWGSMVYSA